MRFLLTVSSFLILFLVAGCGEPEFAPKRQVKPLTPNSPASVRIVGLTRIRQVEEGKNTLEVYLEMRNPAGQQVRTTASFLFELYDYAPRSSEPAGKRLQIWEPQKVGGELDKSTNWKEYLKAYYFELPLEASIPASDGSLLQVTCFTPEQRRLTDTFKLDGPTFQSD